MSVLTQTITAAQVDAKSPIDERLMQAIRQDLYDLDAAIAAAGAFDYQFKLNGYLKRLRIGDGTTTFIPRRRVDGSMISKATTFTSARVMLEQPGDSGTLEVDIRRYTTPNVALAGIEHLFTDAITSIGRAGSSLSTQSITRTASQISTQSISRWKSQLSIQSIVPVSRAFSELGDVYGNTYRNMYRINLSGTVDSDWKAGDTVTVASASNSGNNGTFTILFTNLDGGNNVVVNNSSGAAQDSVAGTVDLDAWKYVFTNPVDSEFVAGEYAVFASHTNAANDGNKIIYATNQGGNNIIVKSSTGVAQGSAAGNANNTRWKYALASAAPSDYVVGEAAFMSSHSSGSNDGNFLIVAVNSGGNNIVVSNYSGVAQGGAAGNIQTQRWTYVFSSDPSSEVSAGDYVWTDDATSSINRGQFVVKQVNRSGGFNIVVYNSSGTTQASSGGNMQSSKVKVKFSADQSSYITTSSRLTLFGLPVGSDGMGLDGDYDVTEVNRGGGGNYNAVVSMYLAPRSRSVSASGRLVLESKSLFDTRPSITYTDFAGKWAQLSTNAVFNATQAVVPANTLIMMDILNIPANGEPRNLTVQLL